MWSDWNYMSGSRRVDTIFEQTCDDDDGMNINFHFRKIKNV